MISNAFVQYLSAFLLMSQSVFGVELTFDLPDSARDCFHEDVKKNTTVILEYQVTKYFLVSFENRLTLN